MTTGTVAVTVDGSDDELRALAGWLRDEDELRGGVRLSSAPIRDGHMGGALDAIVVVLTSATATTLITSVRDWLVARSSDRRVTFKLTEGDRELELICGSAADAEGVLGSARGFLDEGPRSAHQAAAGDQREIQRGH